MCEYCEEGKSIVGDYDVTIYINKNELRVCTWEGDELRNINYCPMCGQKLGASDDTE